MSDDKVVEGIPVEDTNNKLVGERESLLGKMEESLQDSHQGSTVMIEVGGKPTFNISLPVLNEKEEKGRRLRIKVLEEIVDTEKAYLADLNFILKVPTRKKEQNHIYNITNYFFPSCIIELCCAL